MAVLGGRIGLADDALTKRLGDGFGFPRYLQLRVDALHMEADGIDAVAQRGGGRLVAVTFGQEAEGRTSCGVKRCSARVGGEKSRKSATTRLAMAGDIGAPPAITSCRYSKRRERQCLLEQVSRSARTESLEDSGGRRRTVSATSLIAGWESFTSRIPSIPDMPGRPGP